MWLTDLVSGHDDDLAQNFERLQQTAASVARHGRKRGGGETGPNKNKRRKEERNGGKAGSKDKRRGR